MKNTKPICQWTKEECFAEVERLGCKKATELRKKCSAIANRMVKQGWMKEYPWEKYLDYSNPPSKWTKEECFAEVKRLGCKTVNELLKKNVQLAAKMRKEGWMKEYPWEKYLDYSDPISKWSKERCFEELQKCGYITKKELQKGSQPLYKRMRLQGWLNEYSWTPTKRLHDIPVKQWTKERCFAEIDKLGCKNPSELKEKYGSVYNRIKVLGCVNEYPWDSYLERTILNPIFRPLLENVPRAIALPSAIYLYMVEAVGDKTLAGRLLKKIAKTDADTGDRKAIVELLKEKQNEAVDDKEIQKVADETPDSDTKIKENDEPTIEEKEDVDISKEMAENQLANIKAQGEFINQVMKSPTMYNIFNSGDTLKSMLTFMQNELIRLVCAGHKDMVEKFIAENK